MKIHQDQRDPRLNLGIKRGKGGEFDRNDDVNGGHEEGEMMEHVDEVNFGLDGLRRGQSVCVQRSSLLSLLNVCGTLQQRRLLRNHGPARTIIDAVLGFSLDDTPSNLAAAALFFVLTSDVGDDPVIVEVVKEKRKEPPMWRFIELNFVEWLYAILGSTDA
ncbi:wings apart-like protein regulation of heterochromatin protein, partial [Tanacetum coccineum]